MSLIWWRCLKILAFENLNRWDSTRWVEAASIASSLKSLTGSTLVLSSSKITCPNTSLVMFSGIIVLFVMKSEVMTDQYIESSSAWSQYNPCNWDRLSFLFPVNHCFNKWLTLPHKPCIKSILRIHGQTCSLGRSNTFLFPLLAETSYHHKRNIWPIPGIVVETSSSSVVSPSFYTPCIPLLLFLYTWSRWISFWNWELLNACFRFETLSLAAFQYPRHMEHAHYFFHLLDMKRSLSRLLSSQ